MKGFPRDTNRRAHHPDLGRPLRLLSCTASWPIESPHLECLSCCVELPEARRTTCLRHLFRISAYLPRLLCMLPSLIISFHLLPGQVIVISRALLLHRAMDAAGGICAFSGVGPYPASRSAIDVSVRTHEPALCPGRTPAKVS